MRIHICSTVVRAAAVSDHTSSADNRPEGLTGFRLVRQTSPYPLQLWLRHGTLHCMSLLTIITDVTSVSAGLFCDCHVSTATGNSIFIINDHPEAC
jgi:hypothetical protein